MADVLRQQTDATPGPLVAIQPYGTKAPLFCVHPGSGELFSYLPLARLLGSNQPLYGLRAAGLEGEREPFTHIERMAAYYLLNLARQAKLLPPDLGDSHAQYLARVLKSNILAIWRYKPQQYPGRITLFRCDDIVNRAIHRDRTLGWEPFSSEAIAIRHMPGAHSGLLSEPAIRTLVEQLSMAIQSIPQNNR